MQSQTFINIYKLTIQIWKLGCITNKIYNTNKEQVSNKSM